jgi:hypothetical protein
LSFRAQPFRSPVLTASLAASLAICGLGILGPPSLGAQALELSGGDSSLYPAAGGTVSLHGPNYEVSLGAGSANGTFLEGARMLRSTPNGTYIFGDDRIDFQLPTDVFDDSHFLLVRGIGYRANEQDSSVIAFVGTNSQNYNTPFFTAAKFGDPVGVLFVNKKLSRNWQFVSDTVASYNWTQIAALKWTPAAKTEVGISGGIGDRKPFAAASLKMERPRYDVQAAYIDASQQFRRAASLSPLFSEPDKQNILVTARPWSILTLTGGMQNFLVPLPTGTQNAQSSVDQVSASLRLLGAQFSGVLLRSAYEQPSIAAAINHSAAFTFQRSLGSRILLQTNYLVSKPKGASTSVTFLSNLSEQLNSHLSVTENVTYSNGHTSLNFGGQLFTNLVTLSATYDTFYVPAQNQQPFEQALLLDLKFRLLGRLLLHGATYVDPTGHLRYTADASTILNRAPDNAKTAAPVSLGRYVMHGCVVDTMGAPVEGAAVLIDEKPLFSDSTGCFSISESHPRIHRLSLTLSDFLNPGHWRVLSMPASISSTTEESSLEALVVITLARLPASTSGPDGQSAAGQSERQP